MDILRDKDIVCVGYNQTMVKIFLNNVLPRKGLKPISDVEKHLGRYWVKVAKTNTKPLDQFRKQDQSTTTIK